MAGCIAKSSTRQNEALATELSWVYSAVVRILQFIGEFYNFTFIYLASVFSFVHYSCKHTYG